MLILMASWVIPVIIVAIVIICLVLGIIIWGIVTLNSLRGLSIKVDEASSNIDVALTKRFDLLTKMVDTAKGYLVHEKNTLETIVKLRQPAHDASMSEKQQFAEKISDGLDQIKLVVEKYPDLKANKVMIGLTEAIVDVEENLQIARRVYNSNISQYNRRVQFFPSNIIARWKGFVAKDFFEVEPTKREDIKIQF